MIIYGNEPDQAYLVEVPELVGCMADGKSYQEAVKNTELVPQPNLRTEIKDILANKICNDLSVKPVK